MKKFAKRISYSVCSAGLAAALMGCSLAQVTPTAREERTEDWSNIEEVVEDQESVVDENSEIGIGVAEEDSNRPAEEDVQESPAADLSDEESAALQEAGLAFGLETFQLTVQAGDEHTNVMISPLSIECALGMVANGAAGDTLAEMEQLLCGGQPVELYNRYRATYEPGETLQLANSIWIRDDAQRIQVRDEFIEINESVYDAQSYLTPFDESTVVAINDWVNEHTNQMIPKLLDSISPEHVMYLINAAAFEDEWEVPYEETDISEDGTFVNSRQQEEHTAMLYSEENVYLEDEMVTGFLRPYANGNYAFMALLPKDETMPLQTYVENLTAEAYTSLWNERTREKVSVGIPEFSYSYDTELNQVLKQQGMERAFDDRADFSNMADSLDALNIGSVLHKTFIEVNREGTRAAAVTAIAMTGAAVMETKFVMLDRPFVYAIVDQRTGMPIFIGTVNSVEE